MSAEDGNASAAGAAGSGAIPMSDPALGGDEVIGDDGFTQKEREQLNITSAAFEALERGFKEVLNEVVGGKSLEKFRQEYEKLHWTLKKSHENEKRLIKKCRDLNSEIVANAAKIQTALRLSVQDQTSLATLAKELDKAWKMVDGAQEKDKRARETIQRLKEEMKKLSQLVDQGAGMSIGQENKVDFLLQIKETLTKEVEGHLRTIMDHKEKIAELTTAGKEISEKLARSEGTIKQLLSEKKQMSDTIEREKKEKANFTQKMTALQQVSEQQTAKIKQTMDEYNKLEQQREKQNELLAQACTARDENLQKLENLQKTYFELEKDKLQLQKEKKSAEEKRRAAEHAVKAVRVELARQKEENRKKEIQYAKLLKEKEISDEKRAQAEQYLESLKAHIDSVLHTIDQQKKDADTDEKIIAELTVAMKKLGSKLNLANQKNALNVKQIQTNELIKQGYEDEMMNHKYEEQRLRKRNYLLEKAKEKAAMNATMWQHRCMEAQEGMKLKIMECNELTKALLEERDKLRLQQNLYETVRADRNTFHKQQAQQKDDIAEMKRKAKIAQHQLEQLKEEIQNKDNALINEHFAYKRLLAEMKVAKRKLVKRKQVIATADQVMGSQDAEIRALRQKVTEGEIAQHKQRRAYDDLMQERDILGTQLIRRNDELALLYEKVRVQKSTLEKGEKQYYERLQDLRALKIAINNLKQELQIRTQEVTNIDALRNEIYHVQRELLQERTKVKALSEELENPMNVHRWRKLEGSDPHRYELIQKIQTLQKRLIAKTEEAVGKDMQLDEKEKLYTAMKNLVARQPGPEVAEQLSVYQHSLKEKTRKMKAMAAELNMFQAQANEFRYEVEKVSRDNQDIKRKFFEQRKQEQLARSFQKAKNLSNDPLFQQQTAFYSQQPRIAGGGFALSSTAPAATLSPH